MFKIVAAFIVVVTGAISFVIWNKNNKQQLLDQADSFYRAVTSEIDEDSKVSILSALAENPSAKFSDLAALQLAAIYLTKNSGDKQASDLEKAAAIYRQLIEKRSTGEAFRDYAKLMLISLSSRGIDKVGDARAGRAERSEGANVGVDDTSKDGVGAANSGSSAAPKDDTSKDGVGGANSGYSAAPKEGNATIATLLRESDEVGEIKFFRASGLLLRALTSIDRGDKSGAEFAIKALESDPGLPGRTKMIVKDLIKVYGYK